jgi:hypothetical protein
MSALTGAKPRHVVVEDEEGTGLHKEPVKPESPIR